MVVDRQLGGILRGDWGQDIPKIHPPQLSTSLRLCRD